MHPSPAGLLPAEHLLPRVQQEGRAGNVVGAIHQAPARVIRGNEGAVGRTVVGGFRRYDLKPPPPRAPRAAPCRLLLLSMCGRLAAQTPQMAPRTGSRSTRRRNTFRSGSTDTIAKWEAGQAGQLGECQRGSKFTSPKRYTYYGSRGEKSHNLRHPSTHTLHTHTERPGLCYLCTPSRPREAREQFNRYARCVLIPT